MRCTSPNSKGTQCKLDGGTDGRCAFHPAGPSRGLATGRDGAVGPQRSIRIGWRHLIPFVIFCALLPAGILLLLRPAAPAAGPPAAHQVQSFNGWWGTEGGRFQAVLDDLNAIGAQQTGEHGRLVTARGLGAGLTRDATIAAEYPPPDLTAPWVTGMSELAAAGQALTAGNAPRARRLIRAGSGQLGAWSSAVGMQYPDLSISQI